MNYMDIIFIVILVIGGAVGLWKGIIKLAFVFGGVILGILLAGNYYSSLGSALGGSTAANIGGFIIIFLVVLFVIGFVVRKIVERHIRQWRLGWANRLGGMCLGLAIAAAICGVIIMVLGKVVLGIPADVQGYVPPLPHICQSIDAALRDSAMVPGILRYFGGLMHLLPSQFEGVRQFFG